MSRWQLAGRAALAYSLRGSGPVHTDEQKLALVLSSHPDLVGQELNTALAEIDRIALLRLEATVNN